MPVLKITDLKPHPMNGYYFDDIQGDGWNDLLQSVRTSGVTNAITVTKDGTVISGHQRVRACNLLGIEEIPAHVVEYTPEEMAKHKDVKDLIESNLKQRVPGNSNPVKLGRCFAFLEEYYNIKQGNNQHKRMENNFTSSKTAEDLAEENGVTRQTISNYKRLASSIPEMQELLNTGKVTPTTALAIMRQLSEEEQREFAQKVADEKKVSSRIADDYIASIKAEAREEAWQESRATIEQLRRDNRTLANRAAGKTTIVAPEDYEEVKAKADAYDEETQRLNKKLDAVYNEKRQLEDTVRELQTQTVREQANNDFVAGAIYFIAQCGSFIRDVGGYVWIADKLAELPERDRQGYIKAAMAVRDWATVLLQNIERSECGKQEIERIGIESIKE